LLPQKAEIGRIGQRALVNITVEMRQRKRHTRDAPFVEYCAARGRRIGMCGYRSVPTDVLVVIWLVTIFSLFVAKSLSKITTQLNVSLAHVFMEQMSFLSANQQRQSRKTSNFGHPHEITPTRTHLLKSERTTAKPSQSKIR